MKLFQEDNSELICNPYTEQIMERKLTIKDQTFDGPEIKIVDRLNLSLNSDLKSFVH